MGSLECSFTISTDFIYDSHRPLCFYADTIYMVLGGIIPRVILLVDISRVVSPKTKNKKQKTKKPTATFYFDKRLCLLHYEL
jgi:hypothetical protein